MSYQTDRVYRSASLAGYSFKDRLFIRVADLLLYCAIWAIAATLRYESETVRAIDDLFRENETPIFATWHDRIFSSIFRFRRNSVVFLVSQSKDGEYIARALLRFGYGIVRGSSSRGGTRAMLEMINAMRNGLSVGFTVDGPRGPRHKAKSGAVILAKETASPLFPIIFEPTRFWTVRSWDRLQIPVPFSKVRAFIGDVIYVRDGDDVKQETVKLQSSLDDLVGKATVWRTEKAN